MKTNYISSDDKVCEPFVNCFGWGFELLYKGKEIVSEMFTGDYNEQVKEAGIELDIRDHCIYGVWFNDANPSDFSNPVISSSYNDGEERLRMMECGL